MRDITPSISAIIPTHGRVDLTKKAIESLFSSASRYPGQFETLIIDSSSGVDATLIQNACNTTNARYIDGPTSVREKRNLGAKLAIGEILLFIDSDCIASPDFIFEHINSYRQHPEAVGVCGITEFTGYRGYHWSIIELTGLADAFSFAKKYDRVQWCTTSNLSVMRSVFWDLGGFDVNFPFRLGGDDLDLTYRITSKAGPIICNAKAVVFHTIETWSSFRAVGERAFRWGRMGYHIFNKHRELQYFDLPKPLLVLILISAALLVRAKTYIELYSYWVILLSICFYLVADICFMNKDIVGRRKLLIPFAWIYKIIYRSGLIFEFVRNGDLRFLHKKTIFSIYQLVDEWPSNVVRQWNMILYFMAGWTIWNLIK